jgi:hypothetical protein
MKSKIIKINEKDYTISMLPLGKYSEILEAMDKLPELLGTMSGVNQAEMLKVLPKILKNAMPEFIKILNIGSGITEDVLNNEMGLVDVANLFVTVWEVNEFGTLGKVLGRLREVVVLEHATKLKDGSKESLQN